MSKAVYDDERGWHGVMDDDQRGEEYEASKPVASRQELPQATSYRYVGRNGQPHLPECIPHIPGDLRGDMCICDRLRACEQRIESRNRQNVSELLWQIGVTRDDSFAAGVQAAREAVAALWGNCYYECKDQALAAIDALTPNQSNGGRTSVVCHVCQQPVRRDNWYKHVDGTPLCEVKP